MSLTEQLKTAANASGKASGGANTLTAESVLANLSDEERKAIMDKHKEDVALAEARAKEEAARPEIAVKPPGIYSDHCNRIILPGAIDYPWPVGAPFPMDQVADNHKKAVENQLAGMLAKGLAVEVEEEAK